MAVTALCAGLASGIIPSAKAGAAKQTCAAPEEQAAACRPDRRMSEEMGPTAERVQAGFPCLPPGAGSLTTGEVH